MKEKEVFKGMIFTLVEKNVKIHGQEYRRDIIRHPGGVGVLCIIDHKILLVKQYRHAIEKETLEIPAGKLEYGEIPMECGLRELNEEAGYDCEKLELVQSFVSTPGFCDERIYIYKAIHPKKTRNRLSMDEDEEIETIWMDLDEAYEKTKTSEIDDAKTVIAILHAMLERD